MLKSDSVTVSSFEGVLLIKVGRLFYCGWTITAVLFSFEPLGHIIKFIEKKP